MSPGARLVVSDVPFTKTVALDPPLISITEVGVNPLPVSVNRVAAVPPACALVGDSVVIAGKGFTTVNGKIFEVPPFGGAGGGAAGFVTANCKTPAVATSSSVRATCNVVGLMKFDERFVLFTVTIDCDPKLLPVKVSVVNCEPATIVLGDAAMIFGTLLGAGVIVNVSGADVPPPGWLVKITTVAVPGF